MGLLKGKTAGILIEQQYQDLEVWYPALRLQEEGARILFLGTGSSKTYHGKYGYPAQADRTVREINPEDLDVLIIPGGFAPDYLRRFPEPAELVRRMFEKNRIVAAICHGPWLLASAKILKGKTVTCFHAIRDDLIHAGARYTDQEVVVDLPLITSRKPEDLPAFCRAIIQAL